MHCQEKAKKVTEEDTMARLKTSEDEDPLKILKERLAKGEITPEDYLELKELLEE